jgi:Ca2+-binding EF-hand superfamily protein
VPWLEKIFAEVDGNRDGYVVRSELRSYHEKLRPQREAERTKRFDEHFAQADLNHDGKLSRLEVSEKMPQLNQSFAFMDEDRDGFLTRDDLRHSRH